MQALSRALSRPIVTRIATSALVSTSTSTLVLARTMSSTSKQQQQSSSKLIFAPGSNQPSDQSTGSQAAAPPPQQAAQFNIGTLSRHDLDADPFRQFHKWFSDPALSSHVPETVTLSTAELPSGRVSSRMVYLKELDSFAGGSFVIYSNWGTSRKAADVASNAHAALCFWWKPLERQVRVEGRCERLSNDESQVYYDTRARGSRIGAWASQQSSVLRPTTTTTTTTTTTSTDGDNADSSAEKKDDDDGDDGRAMLDAQVRDVEKRFENDEHIPVPDFWGGLRVIPDMVEFWQGRESRLHDRFKYTRMTGETTGHEDGKQQEWKIERLSP